MGNIDERYLFSSATIREQIKVRDSSLESIERALWQICLQLATGREEAEEQRRYTKEVMEEQRTFGRRMIAQNDQMEKEREEKLSRITAAFPAFPPRGVLGNIVHPAAPLDPHPEPQADGIPRDADGSPIPLD